MQDTKQSLLSDAILFLKESHHPKTSWTVKKEQVVSVKPAIKPPPPKETIVKPIAIALEKPPQQVVKQALEPIKEIPVKEPPPKSPLLKPIDESLPLPFEELSKNLLKLFPQFSIKSEPVSDKTAYVELLQAKILIFSFKEGKESDVFLENIQKAINAYHVPAKLFDMSKSGTEEELAVFFQEMQASLILASPALTKKKYFLPFLKELPATSERFLGRGRLLLLEPFETYFTNPEKKKALWQTLCAILKNLNTQG